MTLILPQIGLWNSPAPIEYVGSVTKEENNRYGWDSAGEAGPDIMSIASPGDLCVIAISVSEAGDDVFTWNGMTFTTILNEMKPPFGDQPMYIGYRFIESGDTNPWVSDFYFSGTMWKGLTIVASVFSGVSSYVGYNHIDNGSTGTWPDPPSLTADGKLWVATGHMRNSNSFIAELDTPPSGYEMGASLNQYIPLSHPVSSTALAYKIEAGSSENPGSFSDDGSAAYKWAATTIAFE